MCVCVRESVFGRVCHAASSFPRRSTPCASRCLCVYVRGVCVVCAWCVCMCVCVCVCVTMYLCSQGGQRLALQGVCECGVRVVCVRVCMYM